MFRGTAGPGVHAVAAFCEGRWLGHAELADEVWRFRLPHDWLSGHHTLTFVADGSGGVSEPTRMPFEVLAVPPDNWLRRPAGLWQPCSPSGDCGHIKRQKPRGVKNILE
ncbi:hypothetical protein AB0M94_36530 [Streptomyces xanthochromogenes]|uniref:hypothetical protein n=1 Tax=Streptomyces xanthochromogenes TaxID=67384 RepID=UPI00342E0A49